uniref:Uncharacterized protein n=1 Tax=Chaetoceros debilis TaxID=122233 RepID=A0A7S3VA97_9STRA
MEVYLDQCEINTSTSTSTSSTGKDTKSITYMERVNTNSNMNMNMNMNIMPSVSRFDIRPHDFVWRETTRKNQADTSTNTRTPTKDQNGNGNSNDHDHGPRSPHHGPIATLSIAFDFEPYFREMYTNKIKMDMDMDISSASASAAAASGTTLPLKPNANVQHNQPPSSNTTATISGNAHTHTSTHTHAWSLQHQIEVFDAALIFLSLLVFFMSMVFVDVYIRMLRKERHCVLVRLQQARNRKRDRARARASSKSRTKARSSSRSRSEGMRVQEEEALEEEDVMIDFIVIGSPLLQCFDLSCKGVVQFALAYVRACIYSIQCLMNGTRAVVHGIIYGINTIIHGTSVIHSVKGICKGMVWMVCLPYRGMKCVLSCIIPLFCKPWMWMRKFITSVCMCKKEGKIAMTPKSTITRTRTLTTRPRFRFPSSRRRFKSNLIVGSGSGSGSDGVSGSGSGSGRDYGKATDVVAVAVTVVAPPPIMFQMGKTWNNNNDQQQQQQDQQYSQQNMDKDTDTDMDTVVDKEDHVDIDAMTTSDADVAYAGTGNGDIAGTGAMKMMYYIIMMLPMKVVSFGFSLFYHVTATACVNIQVWKCLIPVQYKYKYTATMKKCRILWTWTWSRQKGFKEESDGDGDESMIGKDHNNRDNIHVRPQVQVQSSTDEKQCGNHAVTQDDGNDNADVGAIDSSTSASNLGSDSIANPITACTKEKITPCPLDGFGTGTTPSGGNDYLPSLCKSTGTKSSSSASESTLTSCSFFRSEYPSTMKKAPKSRQRKMSLPTVISGDNLAKLDQNISTDVPDKELDEPTQVCHGGSELSPTINSTRDSNHSCLASPPRSTHVRGKRREKRNSKENTHQLMRDAQLALYESSLCEVSSDRNTRHSPLVEISAFDKKSLNIEDGSPLYKTKNNRSSGTLSSLSTSGSPFQDKTNSSNGKNVPFPNEDKCSRSQILPVTNTGSDNEINHHPSSFECFDGSPEKCKSTDHRVKFDMGMRGKKRVVESAQKIRDTQLAQYESSLFTVSSDANTSGEKIEDYSDDDKYCDDFDSRDTSIGSFLPNLSVQIAKSLNLESDTYPSETSSRAALAFPLKEVKEVVEVKPISHTTILHTDEQSTSAATSINQRYDSIPQSAVPTRQDPKKEERNDEVDDEKDTEVDPFVSKEEFKYALPEEMKMVIQPVDDSDVHNENDQKEEKIPDRKSTDAVEIENNEISASVADRRHLFEAVAQNQSIKLKPTIKWIPPIKDDTQSQDQVISAMNQELREKLKQRPNFVIQQEATKSSPPKPCTSRREVGTTALTPNLSPCSKFQQSWSQRKSRKLKMPTVFTTDETSKNEHILPLPPPPPTRIKATNKNFSKLVAQWSKEDKVDAICSEAAVDSTIELIPPRETKQDIENILPKRQQEIYRPMPKSSSLSPKGHGNDQPNDSELSFLSNMLE